MYFVEHAAPIIRSFRTLQNAVGLLATVACVHIAITIVLGVILGFVLYTSNRNKAAKRRKENERIVNGKSEVTAGSAAVLWLMYEVLYPLYS